MVIPGMAGQSESVHQPMSPMASCKATRLSTAAEAFCPNPTLFRANVQVMPRQRETVTATTSLLECMRGKYAGLEFCTLRFLISFESFKGENRRPTSVGLLLQAYQQRTLLLNSHVAATSDRLGQCTHALMESSRGKLVVSSVDSHDNIETLRRRKANNMPNSLREDDIFRYSSSSDWLWFTWFVDE